MGKTLKNTNNLKMQKTFLFVTLLVLSAYAGQLGKIFSEVTDTEYGRTLVSSIQLQLEAGSQVDGLIDSMRGVVGGLKQQMGDAQALHESKHDACDADLRELASGLTQAGADAAKYAGLGEFDSATLQTRQEELANKIREVGDRQAMLQTLGEQRAAEADRYANLKAEYAAVFGVLDDCRAIINSRLVAGGDSFLESKTGMQSALVARLRKFTTPKQGVAHGYNAFFKLLAQVVEKSMEVHADQAIVQRLFDIMDRIEENMEMAEAMERDAERTREADYQELVDKVNGQLMYTQRQIVDLRATISTLTDRVAASQMRVQNAADAAANFQQRLDDRGAECEQDTVVWEQFYQNMSAELSTAGKLMYLLEDRRALLSRYGL